MPRIGERTEDAELKDDDTYRRARLNSQLLSSHQSCLKDDFEAGIARAIAQAFDRRTGVKTKLFNYWSKQITERVRQVLP